MAIFRPRDASPELSEAVFRLQGELLSLGLQVELADRAALAVDDAVQRRAELERWAHARGSDALLVIVGTLSPTAVEVWLFEREPPRTSMTLVTLESSSSGSRSTSASHNAAETLALRAIEVLRSSFLEAELARAEQDRPVPSEAAAKQPVQSDRAPPPQQVNTPFKPFGLELGAAVLAGVDGVGPALAPLVRGDWALASWLALQATFAGFGTRPTLTAQAGSARVAQQYAVLGLCYCLDATTKVRPLLSVAAGALRTSLAGQAAAPERGHAVDQWSFVLEAGAGARVGLPAGLYLALASHVQLATPYVAIHFADTVVASSGRPNLLLSTALGARW